MRREFLKDGLVYGSATLLSSLGTVLLVPIYTRALAPAAFGVVDYVNVLQVLIQIMAGLEVTQGIARFYADAATEVERREYASTGFLFLGAAYGVVCGTLFLSAERVGPILFGNDATPAILRAVMVTIYIRVLFYVVQSQLRWELRPMRYAIASLVAVTATVSLTAYLLLVRRVGLPGVFIALSGGYGSGVVFCLFALRGTYSFAIDRGKLALMIRFSLPLTVSSVALFAATYCDRLIVRAVMGFHDLGIYGIGARVAAVVSLASAGFQLGAAPLIYRRYQLPETPATLAQLLRLFIGAGLIGVTALAAFSIELLAVFTAREYFDAWRIVPLLALATILASAYIFLPGLTIHHMTPRFAAINVSAAAVTLVLIALLVRPYGVVGAALGTLAGALTGFTLHAACSQRVYPIPVNWRRIILALAIVAVAIAMSWVLGQTSTTSLFGRVLVFMTAVAGLLAVVVTSEDRTLIGDLMGTRLVAHRNAL